MQFPLAGFNQVDFTAFSNTTHFTTVFMTPALKNAARDRLHFLPMQMRAMYDYVADGLDGVMIGVSRTSFAWTWSGHPDRVNQVAA